MKRTRNLSDCGMKPAILGKMITLRLRKMPWRGDRLLRWIDSLRAILHDTRSVFLELI